MNKTITKSKILYNSEKQPCKKHEKKFGHYAKPFYEFVIFKRS